MLKFAHPEFLYGLYLLPLLILAFWYAHRRKKSILESFANSKLHSVLFPSKSRIKSALKFGILLFSLLLIIIGLANPQIGIKIEEVKQVGIDVFILLDVSMSMNAEDIKPSRLEKAKHEIGKLIQKLKGDRIGLIVFSGRAYVQFPLTTDYSAANLFLSAVDVTSVPQPGTAISEALQVALNSFKEDVETKKAIIVITDGEDHEGELDQVIADAVSREISIYAIGFGSPSGVPIPVYNASGVQVGYKKDNKGSVVLTRLDEETLKNITTQGKGKYFRGTNTDNELDQIYDELSSLEGTEFGATKITEYEDRFYYFLIPAILLLFIETLITEKKSKLFQRIEK